MAYYIQTNSRSAITYETTTLSKQTIEEKIVATGSVVPEDEVNIVPQISGIIDEIFVEEGDERKKGCRFRGFELALHQIILVDPWGSGKKSCAVAAPASALASASLRRAPERANNNNKKTLSD